MKSQQTSQGKEDEPDGEGGVEHAGDEELPRRAGLHLAEDR